MRTRALIVVVFALIITGILTVSRSSSGGEALLTFSNRQLAYPTVEPGEECPVNIGHKEIVPNQEHICCGSSYWHGRGPVYLTFAWNRSNVKEASFGLTRVPTVNGVYQAKQPWVVDPNYEGPILVRGMNVDLKSKSNLFYQGDGKARVPYLELHRPTRNDKSKWFFLPTYLLISEAGCYAVQIDTLDSTDIVVFKVTD